MELAQELVQNRPKVAARSSIEHLINTTNVPGDAERAELSDNDSLRQSKRQKLSPAQLIPTGDVRLSRKGRACMACRRLKVKCDSAQRGSSGCSRCHRLGLECINTKKVQNSSDIDNGHSNSSIVRLERAVEDILAAMKMPSLHMYARSSLHATSTPARSTFGGQTTGQDSQEQDVDEHSIAPTPVDRVHLGKRANIIQADPKGFGNTDQSSHCNIDADLISQSLISLEDANQLLRMYKMGLARYLPFAIMSEDTTLQQIRESSTLLFTAIMVITALHSPGKESAYAKYRIQFLELIAMSLFEPLHTLDDVRALCIAALWQPDLSWKLSCLAVHIAIELNLHQSFYRAFRVDKLSDEQRREAVERSRLWYLVYVIDHHFSVVYGRAPVTAELPSIKESQALLMSRWSTPLDKRLLSHVCLFVIVSRAYDFYGLEAERQMGDNDTSLSMHFNLIQEIRSWKEQWINLLVSENPIDDYLSREIHLLYHFTLLALNSLALRGRPLDASLSKQLPPSLKSIAMNAINSAHAILRMFLEEPSCRAFLVGAPVYVHGMIAFAAIFLIKVSNCWRVVSLTMDPEAITKPLIEGAIQMLKSCEIGTGHVIYGIADGLEKILTKNWGEAALLPFVNDKMHSYIRRKGKQRLREDHQHIHAVQDYHLSLDESRSVVGSNRIFSAQIQMPSERTDQRNLSGVTAMELNVNAPPSHLSSRYPTTSIEDRMASWDEDDSHSLELQDDMQWSLMSRYDLLRAA